MDSAAPTTPVRLVVADMDGTLLDGDGEVPEELWPLLERMHAAGVVFAPASGRQYATLERMFRRHREGMVFIAENGAFVVRDDEVLSASPLAEGTVTAAVTRMRDLAASGEDLGVVVCGQRSAYVERTDRAFLDHVDPYYAALTEVEDLLEVGDDPVKVAVFATGDPEAAVRPALAPLEPEHRVVVSGRHWVDVMRADVHKGVAVRALQESLGVDAAATVVFGDYLNDLEMLDEAHHSFAMANAHPDVADRARHTAPANTENGVVVTLRRLLGDAVDPAG